MAINSATLTEVAELIVVLDAIAMQADSENLDGGVRLLPVSSQPKGNTQAEQTENGEVRLTLSPTEHRCMV